MFQSFPSRFLWGSSTAAAQVETASNHNWRGVKSKDGYLFERTTDHELRRQEDIQYIVQFGSVYRCGVDWARIQPAPMAKFDPKVIEEYRSFFQELQDKGVGIMLVLHHFAHPDWFERNAAWEAEDNIPMYLDFVRQCIKHFGEFVVSWNTFNEPNVYAMNAYLLGNFPPFRKSKYFLANRVLDNMGKAHEIAVDMIKQKSDAPIGISLNTACFQGANWPGKLVASFVRWWFMTRAARPFQKCDYWGLSYYAYMLFDPLPIDTISRKSSLEKRGVPHDKMWGYRPEGLGEVMHQFNKKYLKPIIITENGICTDNQQQRKEAIQDYLQVCLKCISEGVDLRGYIHWSTWDNFEWHLGPTFRFGLVTVDFHTMDRTMTEAGEFYAEIVQKNGIESKTYH